MDIESLLKEFDEKFAIQDKVQNEIPLADMHDFLREKLDVLLDEIEEAVRLEEYKCMNGAEALGLYIARNIIHAHREKK